MSSAYPYKALLAVLCVAMIGLAAMPAQDSVAPARSGYIVASS